MTSLYKTQRGTLTIYCGPMFCGKTTSLINGIRDYPDIHTCMLLKPLFDNRYATHKIVNHDNIACDELQAININKPINIPNHIKTIFVDEAQFLENPHYDGNFTDLVEEWLANGIHVVAGGLDMDFEGKPFRVTADLMAMANIIHKIHARCTICHGPATRTIRKEKAEQRMTLGSSDLYTARCSQHIPQT